MGNCLHSSKSEEPEPEPVQNPPSCEGEGEEEEEESGEEFLSLLPIELLHHIYSYCDSLSLRRLSCCSQAFAESCREVLWHCIALLHADVVSNDLSKDRRINFLCHTSVLRIAAILDTTAEFEQCDKVEKNLSIVFPLCNPKVLNVSFLMDDTFTRFEHLRNVVELSLSGSAVRDDVLIDCGKWLTRLKSFQIQMDRFARTTSCGLEIIGSLSSVQTLTLRNFEHIYKNYIPPKLSQLIIKCCFVFEIQTQISQNFSHLTKLHIERQSDTMPITSSDNFRFIASAISLKELFLSGIRTNEGYSFLGNLVNLEVLVIISFDGNNETLKTIGDNLKKLKKLVLKRCCITDEGVIHLIRLEKLEHLQIGYCYGVTIQGLRLLNTVMINNDTSAPLERRGLYSWSARE